MKDNLVALKEEFTRGYPLVNITREHLYIAEGYKISAVLFNRPKGDGKQGVAKIWLVSLTGDVVEQELKLTFAKSESDRLADAIKPSSFSIRPEVLVRKNPKRISPLEIVPKYEDVIVHTVHAHKVEANVWDIEISFHFSANMQLGKKLFRANLLVDFDDIDTLDSFSSDDTVEIGLIRSQNDQQTVLNNTAVPHTDISDFVIADDFINSAPPVVPTKNAIKAGSDVIIKRLDYIPPIDVDATQAALDVKYSKDGQLFAERVIFNFRDSIRTDAVNKIKQINPFDFKYLPEDRLTAPVTISAKDFVYKGKIPGVSIKDVQYAYADVDPNLRFIAVDIIVELRLIHFKVKRVIEFAYSKNEYMQGAHIRIQTESSSVAIPKKFKDPDVIEKLYMGSKQLKKELINSIEIINGYPYSRITDVNFVRYLRDSNLVIFLIDVIERRGNDEFPRKFEKHFLLDESYYERQLDKLSSDDILINMDRKPLAPPHDFSDDILIAPEWAKIVALQYAQPEMDQKTMALQVKVVVGRKMKFLEKEITFEESRYEQFQDELEAQDRKYLREIDPKDIYIVVDVTGAPVDSITPEDIYGLPEGVQVSVDYQKPPVGEKITRMRLHLKRGNVKIAFEQSIEFAEPTK